MTHISDFGFHLHFVFCGLYNSMWLFDCKITNRFSLFTGDLDFSQYTITYSSKYPNLIASFDKIVVTFAHKVPIDGIKQEIVKDHEWIKRHTSILQYKDRDKHTIVKQMFRHSRVYKWFVFLDIERRVSKISLHITHHNRVLHGSEASSHQGVELKLTEVVTKRKAPRYT